MIGEVTIDDARAQHAFKVAPGIMLKHTDRATGRAGLTLARAMRAELRENESMGQSTLLNSIRSDRPFPAVRVVRTGVKYAKAVEDGSKAGRLPPLEPLMAWIKAKEGAVDNLRLRAMGLAKHIQAHGTKPHPYAKPALEKTRSELVQTLLGGVSAGLRETFGTRGMI